MPGFYKRKGNCRRGEWSEQQLSAAIEAVNNGMGVNEAARRFSVPCTTLRRRRKTGNTKKIPLGPSPSLGEVNEKKVATHIKKMQKFGFAPTQSMVREMAYGLAEKLKIHHKFNKNKKRAGKDWFKAFMKRNTDLSIRKSEGVSLARARAMNRTDVGNYFELLQQVLEQNNLIDKPGSLFNMDETGLQLNNRPEYVVAEKGSKNVAAITSGEKGETISVIACCNAEGLFIPPMCIFKGKNKKNEYEDGMPPGSIVCMSEKSAYINTSIFFNWLQNQFLPRKPQGPVVLILDGHSSHVSSVDVLELAEQNQIILICLPSHSTQFLQPLDRSFFKAFKSYYYAACNTFVRANPTRSINRLQFGKLLAEAWSKSATVENAVSSFRATGIYPFRPDAIPDYAFLNNDEATIPEVTEPEAPNISKKDNVQENVDGTAESPGKILDYINPIPSTSKVENVRKRGRQLAEVLTSPENILKRKTMLEKKMDAIKRKEARQAKNKSQPRSKKEKSKRGKTRDLSTSSDSSASDEEAMALDSDTASESLEYECVGCGEIYEQTKSKEDWIECVVCRRWLHEGCTSFSNMCLRCGKRSS